MKANPFSEEPEFDVFEAKTVPLINKLRKIVEQRMIKDGDTEETSQRICILNRLNDLEAHIYGTTTEDLKPVSKKLRGVKLLIP